MSRAAKNSGTRQVTIVKFDNSGKKVGPMTVDKVVMSDEEWKKKLTPEEFDVTRKEGTERTEVKSFLNESALTVQLHPATTLEKS